MGSWGAEERVLESPWKGSLEELLLSSRSQLGTHWLISNQLVSQNMRERERETESLGKEESFFTRHLNGGGNIRGKEREEDHVVKRERWDLSLNPFCIYITDCAGMEQSVVRKEMGFGHVPTPHRGTK